MKYYVIIVLSALEQNIWTGGDLSWAPVQGKEGRGASGHSKGVKLHPPSSDHPLSLTPTPAFSNLNYHYARAALGSQYSIVIIAIVLIDNRL